VCAAARQRGRIEPGPMERFYPADRGAAIKHVAAPATATSLARNPL